jgi:hypothetical protein
MKKLVEWTVWLVFAEGPGEWSRKEWVCRTNRQ